MFLKTVPIPLKLYGKDTVGDNCDSEGDAEDTDEADDLDGDYQDNFGVDFQKDKEKTNKDFGRSI